MSITREELKVGVEYIVNSRTIVKVLHIGNKEVFFRYENDDEISTTLSFALAAWSLKPKIKKWLWMKEMGGVTSHFYTEDEVYHLWTKTNCFVEVEK